MPSKDWQSLSRAVEDDSVPSSYEINASSSESEESATSPNISKPKQDRILGKWRRSERVRVEMLVEVCVCSDDNEGEEPVFTRGKTLDVNAHGALLDVTMPVDIGQTLRLINVRTKREIECHVLRFAKRYPEGGGQIGVEFAGVSRHFWGISSPPADWDPEWVRPEQPERPVPQLAPPAPLPAGIDRTSPPSAKPQTVTVRRERVQAPAIEREVQVRSGVPTKLTVALVALVILITAWMTLRSPSGGNDANAQPAGVESEDARRIPRIDRTRLATVGDFDSDAVSWLRDSGQQASGKISGFYSGSKKSNAYVLVGEANQRRVVILAGGQLQYNAEYPRVAVAACVPMELVRKIKWADPAVPESDGDGLLIVRSADAPASGVVLFLRNSQVVAASPANYRDIEFEHGCQP